MSAAAEGDLEAMAERVRTLEFEAKCRSAVKPNGAFDGAAFGAAIAERVVDLVGRATAPQKAEIAQLKEAVRLLTAALEKRR